MFINTQRSELKSATGKAVNFHDDDTLSFLCAQGHFGWSYKGISPKNDNSREAFTGKLLYVNSFIQGPIQRLSPTILSVIWIGEQTFFMKSSKSSDPINGYEVMKSVYLRLWQNGALFRKHVLALHSCHPSSIYQ